MTELVAHVRNLPEVQREQAVTAYLTAARARLAEALTATEVVEVKAMVTSIADLTKNLDLSKECRDDATEMVRRAEYALGKAVRAGQERGEIATQGVRNDRLLANSERLPTAIDVAPEIYQNGSQILSMVDGVGEGEFEEALTEARAEGNLSRANVVRKVKGQQQGTRSRAQLADEIGALAGTGMASSQIAKRVGVSEQWVRETAREFDVEIPADRVVGKTRRVDSARVVREAVSTLEGVLITLPLVDVESLDPHEAQEWTASLDQSIRALNRFNKKIKEAVL